MNTPRTNALQSVWVGVEVGMQVSELGQNPVRSVFLVQLFCVGRRNVTMGDKTSQGDEFANQSHLEITEFAREGRAQLCLA
jgi:hypothetical protein